MRITSAEFLRGVTGPDDLLGDGTPQVAFIGRSNVGKSSVINSLTRERDLARTSAFPGRTREINVFLINKSIYLLDLPGYGYAKASHEGRERLRALIAWYLFESPYGQKAVALIVDANVGLTQDDLDMLRALESHGKHVVIVANKVDKLKKSQYEAKLEAISISAGAHRVIPYSSYQKIGTSELADAILSEPVK